MNNTWDRANNLTGVESALKNVEGTLENYKVNYTYDALGRRVTRTPDASVTNDSYNNITKQNYVYSGASWDMTSEYTDRTTGTDVHTNYLTANLGKGTPTLIASEDVQERTANSDVNTWTKVADESSSELDPEHNFIITPDSVQKFAYYQRDEFDSIVSKTNLEVRYKGSNETGTLIVNPTLNIINIYKVANQNRTDEYGKKLNDTATTPESGTLTDNWSTRGYSGQVYDIESATYYYGSRNYDPANGTWTKQDSYRGTYTDPETRNRYSFVADDPVNEIDIDGFSTLYDLTNLRDQYVKKRNATRALLNGMKSVADDYFSALSDFNNSNARLKSIREDLDKARKYNILGINNKKVKTLEGQYNQELRVNYTSQHIYNMVKSNYAKVYGNINNYWALTNTYQGLIDKYQDLIISLDHQISKQREIERNNRKDTHTDKGPSKTDTKSNKATQQSTINLCSDNNSPMCRQNMRELYSFIVNQYIDQLITKAKIDSTKEEMYRLAMKCEDDPGTTGCQNVIRYFSVSFGWKSKEDSMYEQAIGRLSKCKKEGKDSCAFAEYGLEDLSNAKIKVKKGDKEVTVNGYVSKTSGAITIAGIGIDSLEEAKMIREGTKGAKSVVALGIVIDSYEIVKSENPQRTATGKVGGWTGTWAGVKVGCYLGGSAGMYVPIAYSPAIGCAVGGFIGGYGGYKGGENLGLNFYDHIPRGYNY